MNILYLCNEYPPGRHGGIGTAVQSLAKEMVRKGHTVVVAGFYDWGYGGEDYFIDEGVKVYRFRRILSSRLLNKQHSLIIRLLYKFFLLSGMYNRDIRKSLHKYKFFLEELIRKYAIDIIEMPDFNDYMLSCNEYIPFPVLSAPTIVKLHGSVSYFRKEQNLPVSKALWEMEHALLMNADAVCSVSNYTARKTAEYLKYTLPITTLYNGIEVQQISSIQKTPGRVIFTGTLIPKKGINQLLQAWNIVNETMPGASLYLLGKGPVKKLEKILNRHTRPTVFFLGHVPKNTLYELLARAYVGVFPSFAESFGLAPLEAAMCNTAVIFSNRTSGPELFEDGVTGYLVDPGNVEEIAQKIILLLSNPDLCEKLANAGKQNVINKFDIKVVADQHIDFYKSVLNVK